MKSHTTYLSLFCIFLFSGKESIKYLKWQYYVNNYFEANRNKKIKIRKPKNWYDIMVNTEYVRQYADKTKLISFEFFIGLNWFVYEILEIIPGIDVVAFFLNQMLTSKWRIQ